MNEAMREHLPPFLAVPHIIRAELQGVEIQSAVETQQAHDDSDGYDDKGYHECKDTDNPDSLSRGEAARLGRSAENDYIYADKSRLRGSK